MVCDGQRVAVPPVAERELAFEVGAPQVIGHGALGQRRAARAVARPPATLDHAVATENRMDGAFGRYSDIAAEPPDRSSRILRAPQCGFSAFSRTIRLSTCCGSWLGERTGRRGPSPRAENPRPLLR